ncbi:MAG: ParB/RepB/Spo0J family partition protein [Planctomycetes bacterium]|nr:ParB/RepB/Spo0J family partition protein [Planctomycetota bacterium]
MSKTARRLGRGLNSLVSDLTNVAPVRVPDAAAAIERIVPAPALNAERGGEVATLRLEELVQNPFQPRREISSDDVSSLAESMKNSGLLQPIAVRRVDGGYEIIAGERRWAAAKLLGMKRIPAIVREATDEQMLELALVENIQREDLNAIDRAMAYRRFCNRFQLKPEEVARRIGEDRTTVINYLRLLDLPETIRAMVAKGSLSMGHARCLLGIEEDARCEELAESVTANQLSVRALEEIVRREKTRGSQPGSAPPETPPWRSAHLRDLQERFEQSLKTKVVIQESRRKGSGRITIEYYSLADFDRLAAKLGVTLE